MRPSLRCLAWLASLGAVTRAQVYILHVGNVPVALNFPRVDNVPITVVEDQLKKFNLDLHGMEKIQFDRAAKCMDVMRLPLCFFQDSLTPEQLIQIILNDKLKPLIASKREPSLLRKVDDKDLLKLKLDALHRRLSLLDRDNLGPNQDEVVRRLPTSLYRFLHPYVALTADTFKCTIKGIIRLFEISWETVKKLVSKLRTAVYSAIQATVEAVQKFKKDERVIRVARILGPIVRQIPDLALTSLRIAIVVIQIAMITGILVLKSGTPSPDGHALLESYNREFRRRLGVRVLDASPAREEGQTGGALPEQVLYHRVGLAMPLPPLASVVKTPTTSNLVIDFDQLSHSSNDNSKCSEDSSSDRSCRSPCPSTCDERSSNLSGSPCPSTCDGRSSNLSGSPCPSTCDGRSSNAGSTVKVSDSDQEFFSSPYYSGSDNDSNGPEHHVAAEEFDSDFEKKSEDVHFEGSGVLNVTVEIPERGGEHESQ